MACGVPPPEGLCAEPEKPLGHGPGLSLGSVDPHLSSAMV